MYQAIYSYDSFIKFMESNGLSNNDLPYIGVNDKGENVIYSIVKDNDTGEVYYQTETCQSNGWIRTNTYYRNGSSEELYSK